MRLVMVHGISQEDSTEAELLARWSKLITDQAPDVLNGIDTQMAYDGKELAKWTAAM